jgi:16S rRNA (uracil1498-N3)-methyltransferase
VSVPRFFCDSASLVAGETAFLAREEWRHVRVRRLADGDAVVLLDGSGLEAEAVLTAGGTAARVGLVRNGAAEPRIHVTVLLAAAEPSRVEWAVEKGTECGALAFVLLATERSQDAHVRALAAKDDRLLRIAREAVKQCGRSRVPSVYGPVDLADALAVVSRPVLVASRGARLAEAAALDARSLSIAIGPEGGFSPAEDERFAEAGALFVGLGPRTLRLETAVVALLSRLAIG